MVSKKLEDEFKRFQLDTEDIVIETADMLKRRYDDNMDKVVDIIALWWINNDIKSLTDAQSNMSKLMSELDGVLDPANEKLIEDMTELFAEVYASNYEWAKGALEIENDTSKDDALLMFALLGFASTPWTEDNLTYSQRMILRNEQLKNELKSIVQKASVMKLSTKKLLDMVRGEMGKQKYRGTNVLVDESNHFANEAVRQLAIEKYGGYEISEVLDMKTCDHCRTMHGKRYLWSEYEVGLTAPMFHNSCRGRIIPINKL